MFKLKCLNSISCKYFLIMLCSPLTILLGLLVVIGTIEEYSTIVEILIAILFASAAYLFLIVGLNGSDEIKYEYKKEKQLIIKFSIYSVNLDRSLPSIPIGQQKPYSKAYLEGNRWYIDISNLDELLKVLHDVENPLVLYDRKANILDSKPLEEPITEYGLLIYDDCLE